MSAGVCVRASYSLMRFQHSGRVVTHGVRRGEGGCGSGRSKASAAAVTALPRCALQLTVLVRVGTSTWLLSCVSGGPGGGGGTQTRSSGNEKSACAAHEVKISALAVGKYIIGQMVGRRNLSSNSSSFSVVQVERRHERFSTCSVHAEAKLLEHGILEQNTYGRSRFARCSRIHAL